MKKKIGVQIVCFLTSMSLFMVLSPARSSAEVPRPQKVFLRASGGPAGTGKDLAIQFPCEAIRRGNRGWSVDVINGPTTLAEIGMIRRGEIDISRVEFAQIYNIRNGYYGEKKLSHPVELRWLAPSVVYAWGFYILENVPVNSIAELKEKRYPLKFSMGRKGTAPYNATLMLLRAYDLNPDDILKWGGKIQYQASRRTAELMADGLIEAYLFGGEIPNNPLTELSRKRKLKAYFASEPEIQAKLKEKGFVRFVVKASYYSFVKEDTITMGVPSGLVSSVKMKKDVAYHIVRAIWEQREKFLSDIHPMFKNYLQPEVVSGWGAEFADILHPGAAQFYREQGFLK